jgi:predicted alpha/beta hydrolase family esterase
MNMTSILTRALILVAFGAGVSIAIANRVERTHAPAIAGALKVANAQTASPVAAAVELPTISVRPSMTELADAMNENDETVSAHAVPASNRPQYLRAAPTLPTLGMDMPYYSFGKALPRVSKE